MCQSVPIGCSAVEPFLGRPALVELALLGLGREADAALHVRVGHGNEVPRLLVRAARGRAGGCDAGGDHFTRDRTGVEVADGAAALHQRVEVLGATQHFGFRQRLGAWQRDGLRIRHWIVSSAARSSSATVQAL